MQIQPAYRHVGHFQSHHDARMFRGAKSFNQPIGDWNISNVIDMREMFLEAIAYNQPIGDWDTSKVIQKQGMFRDAASYSYPIPKGAK